MTERDRVSPKLKDTTLITRIIDGVSDKAIGSFLDSHMKFFPSGIIISDNPYMDDFAYQFPGLEIVGPAKKNYEIVKMTRTNKVFFMGVNERMYKHDLERLADNLIDGLSYRLNIFVMDDNNSMYLDHQLRIIDKKGGHASNIEILKTPIFRYQLDKNLEYNINCKIISS